MSRVDPSELASLREFAATVSETIGMTVVVNDDLSMNAAGWGVSAFAHPIYARKFLFGMQAGASLARRADAV